MGDRPCLAVKSVEEARKVQDRLREKVVTSATIELGEISTVAGVDVSYSRHDNRVFAAVCVFTFPDLELLSVKSGFRRASFPYVPGYLAFREIPAFISVINRLDELPQVILVDGHGIAHPRGLGVASHLGVLLCIPTVGVAKKLLVGEYEVPPTTPGSSSPVIHDGKTVGSVLRTRENVKPVFVSPGYGVDLDLSVSIVFSCCCGYRLPEPLRAAHREANALRARIS